MENRTREKGAIIITSEQKYSVIRLRGQGVGYAEIGRELGIPRDTVKSFCRRNGLLISGSKVNTFTPGENNSVDSNPTESNPVNSNPAVSSPVDINPVDSNLIDNNDRCRQCGEPLVQQEKKKRRIFCCKSCREKWWTEHAEKINRKAVYTFTCAGCGRSFTAYGNKNRKYCSHGCYIADRFRRENHTISVGVNHADKEGADG